jgi:hypothetical protein
MKIIRIEKKNNELVLHVPMEGPKISASGKTMVIASSHGRMMTNVVINGEPLFINFSAYTYGAKDEE